MSTEFTDSSTESENGSGFSASEPAQVEKKKSSNKVIIVVALLAVVAVVGFYGMRIMNKSAAPAPQPQATLPVDGPAPQAEAPDQEDPLAALANAPATPDALGPVDESMDPLAAGTDPLAAPGVPGGLPSGDPMNPMGQMPAQDAGLDQPAMPVAADPMNPAQAQPSKVQPAPVMDPSLAALTTPGASAPTPVEVAPVVSATPASIQPVTPVNAVSHPPVSSSGSFDASSLASVVGQAVTDALRPMEERWNARFDSLESRVSRVEGSPRPAAAKPAATPRPRAARPKPAPVARPRATPAAPAPANRIELIDQPSVAPVARPAVVVAPRVEAAQPSNTSSCSLGAVLEGRAWIKRGDGSFDSYIVGDTLPDGKVISAITPERGIVVGNKTWSCSN